MRNYRLSFLIILLLIQQTACDQDSVNGNLLAKLKSNGRTISQSTIYLNLGTRTNPNIPVEQYDLVQRADGTGEAYFKDLIPGQYFIYSTGYDQELKKEVHGESSITIVSKHKQNKYEITVNAIL